MTYSKFGQQIFAVISALQDSLEQFPAKRVLPVAANWRETQAILQRVAEDLMVCTDVPQAVAKLREDQAALLTVVWLTTDVEDSDLLLAIRQAYSETDEPSENLPGQPLAAYLLEISKWTEPPHMRKR